MGQLTGKLRQLAGLFSSSGDDVELELPFLFLVGQKGQLAAVRRPGNTALGMFARAFAGCDAPWLRGWLLHVGDVNGRRSNPGAPQCFDPGYAPTIRRDGDILELPRGKHAIEHRVQRTIRAVRLPPRAIAHAPRKQTKRQQKSV